MTAAMSLPIDYARAESADVVRKKFRRRVVMFVVATVVVMGIGFGWGATANREIWLIGTANLNSPVSVQSAFRWIEIYGPMRRTASNATRPSNYEQYGNRTLGIVFAKSHRNGLPKWIIYIRYRTLFILATIPWIITLIRLIRIWKRKRVFETEPRTQ